MNRMTATLPLLLLVAGFATAHAGEPAVSAQDGMLVAEDTSRSVGTTVDDATITTKVKSKLIGESELKARKIDVDTRNGVVELHGSVEDAAEAQLAERIAGDTQGVTLVVNRLTVRGGD